MISYSVVILGILIFSLMTTVILLGYVAFGTTPKRRPPRH